MNRRRRRLLMGGFGTGVISSLAPNVWLEMDGAGALRGSTAGTYSGALNNEAAILAALTGNEFCSSWSNKSPATAGPFAEAVEANQPGWLQASENAFVTPAIGFVAASNTRLVDGTPVDFTAGGSVAIVFETDTVAATQQCLFFSVTGSSNRFVIGLNSAEIRAGRFNGTAFVGGRSGAVAASTKYVVQYYLSGTTGTFYLNGAELVGGNNPTNLTSTTVGMSIGSRADLAGAPFDGRIVAVIAKAGAEGWGLGKRTAVDNYLKGRYGVSF